VGYARALSVTAEPGKTFSYNNEAVQLLAAVVEAAAGEPVDAYVAKRILRPIGVANWTWKRDRRGNVQTFSGLALSARDLARLGQLLLDRGISSSKRVLAANAIDAVTTPSGPPCGCGLLWWIRQSPAYQVQTAKRLEALTQAGFSAASKLLPLTGKRFQFAGQYWMEAGALLDAGERTALADLSWRGTSPTDQVSSQKIGFYADGWLGQKVVVYPEKRLVVVRLRRAANTPATSDVQRASFADLFDRLESIDW